MSNKVETIQKIIDFLAKENIEGFIFAGLQSFDDKPAQVMGVCGASKAHILLGLLDHIEKGVREHVEEILTDNDI